MRNLKLCFVLCMISFGLFSCSPEQQESIEKDVEKKILQRITSSNIFNKTVNLSNFQHVYQSRVPTGFWNNSNYGNDETHCDYPVFIGASGSSNDYEISRTNLCGIASFLMGTSLVNHDPLFDLASGSSTYAKMQHADLLAEATKRYKDFKSSYNFGNSTYLYDIARMTYGLSYRKGSYTNWNDCNNLKRGYSFTDYHRSTTRENAKTFIKNSIDNGYPVIAIVGVKGGKYDKPNPYSETEVNTYLSGNQGHMVLIVGLYLDDTNNTYKIRYKDPLYEDGSTYTATYSNFLNAMIRTTSGYNALVLEGK